MQKSQEKRQIERLYRQLMELLEAKNHDAMHHWLFDLLLTTFFSATNHEAALADKEWQKIKSLLLNDNEANQELGTELLEAQHSPHLKAYFIMLWQSSEYQICKESFIWIENYMIDYLELEKTVNEMRHNQENMKKKLEKMRQGNPPHAEMKAYEEELAKAIKGIEEWDEPTVNYSLGNEAYRVAKEIYQLLQVARQAALG